MPKTLVFFNDSWTRSLQPMSFYDCFHMSARQLLDVFHATQYCTNTETYLMTDCLLKIFDAQRVYPNDIRTMKEAHADSIVVNGLHCISGKCGFDKEYWQSILDLGIKVVPMPFGFWYHGGDDWLTEDALYIVQQIAERNEIGVRGEYAADILNKAGIKNVRVIGDISLMYPMNRELTIHNVDRPLRRINVDFTNFYPFEFHEEAYFIKYIFPIFQYFKKMWKEKYYDISYTSMQCPMENIINHTELEKDPESLRFLLERGRFFFSVKEWTEAISRDDFSFGTRFHGGIASIIAGTPALLIALDRRMEELLKVCHIPFLLPEQFDPQEPLTHYAELCDYSEFNKNYPALYDNFLEYCAVNDVSLNINRGKNTYA